MIERVPTHIEGFDELIQGGLPKGSAVLVSGGPGSGKTIFCMQYIYEGAKHGEAGLYVTIETNLKNILWDMQSFKWDINSMQEKNLMKVYRLHLTAVDSDEAIQEQIENELETIKTIVKEIGAKKLVIDSVSAFAFWIRNQAFLRHMLFEFVDALKELGCTTILISETRGEKMDFSTFGVEEFITDSVVMLYFIPPHRALFIRKMRGTKHSQTPHPFEISDSGIKVRPRDEMLWEAIK
ncbi:MAG: ATPase domain-containing protein [Candidatus Diapherotrites archaeon]|nr:ATPase domain-containing protein [Candidatus Diapherotrites archaeon]